VKDTQKMGEQFSEIQQTLQLYMTVA